MEGVQLAGRDLDDAISLLVEFETVTSPQTLLTLEKPGEVVIEVTQGPVEILYRTEKRGPIRNLKRVTYRSKTVRLPALRAGDPAYSSWLRITVDGVTVCENLRVAAVEPQVFKTWWEADFLDRAILRIDPTARYVLADSTRIPPEEWVREAKKGTLDRLREIGPHVAEPGLPPPV